MSSRRAHPRDARGGDRPSVSPGLFEVLELLGPGRACCARLARCIVCWRASKELHGVRRERVSAHCRLSSERSSTSAADSTFFAHFQLRSRSWHLGCTSLARRVAERAQGGRRGKRRSWICIDGSAKQREIASKGGKAAHQKGTAHEWTSEEARDAGRKGGIASHRRRREQKDSGETRETGRRGVRRSRPRTDESRVSRRYWTMIARGDSGGLPARATDTSPS